MKIYVLTPYWKNSFGGGVKNYSINLADSLKKYYNVTVLYREGTDKYQYKMGDNKILFISNSMLFLFKRRPKIILALGSWYCVAPSIIFKYLFKTYVVFITLSEQEKLSLIKRIIDKFILKQVDCIVVNNNISRRHYEKELKMAFYNVLNIPVAAHVEPVTNEQVVQFRKSYGIEDNEKIILIQGFLSNKIKFDGLLLCLKIIKKLNEKNRIKLIVTGYGAYYNDVLNFIIKNNLKKYVVMTGFLDNPFIPLKGCDIFLFPWLGEDEGGLSLIEAMLMGKPIVYARKTNYSEIITHNYNGLISGISENEIIININKLLLDKLLSQKLGENAKKHATELYNWDTYVKKINDHLKNVNII